MIIDPYVHLRTHVPVVYVVTGFGRGSFTDIKVFANADHAREYVDTNLSFFSNYTITQVEISDPYFDTGTGLLALETESLETESLETKSLETECIKE